MSDDEPKDAQEELDEEEDEDETLDPEKLKKKGLHIEGEDDIIDPDLAVADSLLAPDPLADDLDTPMSGEEDENEVDLEDDEFSDKVDW